ncbi:hypothetical protein M427DRAFT_68947 [Gonapodya prolifera JEL478]|uniref:Uncharacterized protein n=1 Tax=Gonapodya prolifera (strain JEL478) TaxID=1344416 RepID=A0A139AIT9_GONPJ|nr:hypothetical protein M427DRAFT_68947 [Gonapodya prolifera JEL478]|eukprot:KXS16648.1 hypothetical protein M427DRAFT_68947 [Gonapodya prolifera JEL478]
MIRSLLLSATLLGCSLISSVAAQAVTLTWDAAAVDAQCKAAVTGSGNTYEGKFDITYSFGSSGAQSGTIGTGVTIADGTFTANVNYTLGPTWSFSACCISPTAMGGAKFRCCCGAGTFPLNPATSTAPTDVYPICPSDTMLVGPVATLGDGALVYQYGPVNFCSGCDREAQGVTKWDIAKNQCVTQNGGTGASPAPAPATSAAAPDATPAAVPTPIASAPTSLSASASAASRSTTSKASTTTRASTSAATSIASTSPGTSSAQGNGASGTAAVSLVGLLLAAVAAVAVV